MTEHPGKKKWVQPEKEVKLVTKPWGNGMIDGVGNVGELWLNYRRAEEIGEEKKRYVLKKLFIKAGTKTSFQYHIHKAETNHIISGTAEAWFENEKGEIEKSVLDPGDSWSIPAGKKHRLIALTDVVLLEASSPEVEDVIRIADDTKRLDGGLGRLILTDREDMVETLRDFYLGTRTDFLVVACNRATTDLQKFSETENFKLLPFVGPVDPKVISGDQHRVWIEAAKKFPNIERWVIHEYDFVCRPPDKDIWKHIGQNQYGTVGTPFPMWQEGMDKNGEGFDTYPFPQAHRFWGKFSPDPADKKVEQALMTSYLREYRGFKTVIAGYSYFIAASRADILKLDDARLGGVHGGIERIPHTILSFYEVMPVDLRQHYKTKVAMDAAYIALQGSYDFLYPVKFWSKGAAPGMRAQAKYLERASKTLVKKIIRYRGWRR